jgi:isoquinoline 1-oxidoreductase alpha subunit
MAFKAERPIGGPFQPDRCPYKVGVMRFTVNGQPVEYRMDPRTPLLWALRDASNLTGTKYGCGSGECGACTVHIDGNAVRSCQVTIAQIEGSFVTTIEALSRDRSHQVHKALLQQSVPQCGFCQSCIIMAAAALIDKNPNPTDADIDSAITNICRCGTYPRIREAIRLAGRVKSGQEQVAAAPPPGIDPADAAREVPAIRKLPGRGK